MIGCRFNDRRVNFVPVEKGQDEEEPYVYGYIKGMRDMPFGRLYGRLYPCHGMTFVPCGSTPDWR
jgi:hypothetical protein